MANGILIGCLATIGVIIVILMLLAGGYFWWRHKRSQLKFIEPNEDEESTSGSLRFVITHIIIHFLSTLFRFNFVCFALSLPAACQFKMIYLVSNSNGSQPFSCYSFHTRSFRADPVHLQRSYSLFSHVLSCGNLFNQNHQQFICFRFHFASSNIQFIITETVLAVFWK